MDMPDTITIRRARASDVDDVLRIYTGRTAYSGTLQLPYPSEAFWTYRLTNPPEGTHDLVAVVGDTVVGMVALHCFPHKPRRAHAASIGIGVHDEWQGKGIGTTLMEAAIDLADNWLNLVRLELEVFADNEAAIRLYARFGFVVEGRHVAHAFRDGAYVDSIAMARIRTERLG
jgi:putative acetyltransferase